MGIKQTKELTTARPTGKPCVQTTASKKLAWRWSLVGQTLLFNQGDQVGLHEFMILTCRAL